MKADTGKSSHLSYNAILEHDHVCLFQHSMNLNDSTLLCLVFRDIISLIMNLFLKKQSGYNSNLVKKIPFWFLYFGANFILVLMFLEL